MLRRVSRASAGEEAGAEGAWAKGAGAEEAGAEEVGAEEAGAEEAGAEEVGAEEAGAEEERGNEFLRCRAKRPVTAFAGTRLLFPALYSFSTKVETGRLRPTA